MSSTGSYNPRAFWILLLTQIFSMLGSAMTHFAIGVWIYTETGNTTPLLLVAFFYWLPPVLLNSIAGVFADRYRRKRLIILGDLGQAVPTLLLALSFLSGHFEIWHLYAAVTLQSLFALLQGPSIDASITLLVPDEHRNRANALLSVAQPIAGLLAPALGAALYGLIDIEGVITVDLFTFLLAVAIIAQIDIPQPAREEQRAGQTSSVWREAGDGLRFLRQRRGLLLLTLYFTFLNLVTNGPLMLRTPYLLELTGDEQTLGILLTISSVGLVSGGLIPFVWNGTSRRVDTIFPALMLGAVGMMVFALVRQPLALGLVGFLMQLPYKLSNALMSSIWQSKVPPNMQGRIFAFGSQLALLALPLTYVVSGPLVDNVLEPAVGTGAWRLAAPLVGSEPGAGIALYILASGVLWLLGTVLVYASPLVRDLERQLPDYRPVAASA